ncbi:TPA: bifunctional adenosylcobinamide kinase/adenosylcobinamide-phosphate guanylyltransferase [bacterium]|nr:bifunctional adenosylcobinamide kinase/adenosylcobinamide-phosphate guanylyltransferase [bacterium]
MNRDHKLLVGRPKIFIFGGVRSGKTSYAINLAKNIGGSVIYIATCIFFDDEMEKRIEIHKKMRPKEWRTIEEGKSLSSVIRDISCDVAIIDCLGIYISNLLVEGFLDDEILKDISDIKDIIKTKDFSVILISNEVGLGVVPNDSLSRRFCDIIGISNQMMAEEFDEVIFMRAGIPIKMKGYEEAK